MSGTPTKNNKRPLEERLSSPPAAPSSRGRKASPPKSARRVTPSVEPMLRHVVMFQIKPSATADQKEAMAAGIRGMTEKIPEILKMTCGPDLGISDGNHGFVLCAPPSDQQPA